MLRMASPDEAEPMTVVSFLTCAWKERRKNSVRGYYPRPCAALQALLTPLTNFDRQTLQSDKNVGSNIDADWRTFPSRSPHRSGCAKNNFAWRTKTSIESS